MTSTKDVLDHHIELRHQSVEGEQTTARGHTGRFISFAGAATWDWVGGAAPEF